MVCESNAIHSRAESNQAAFTKSALETRRALLFGKPIKISLIATAKAEPGNIMLPPCISKQSKLHATTTHPWATKVTVFVVPAGDAVAPEDSDEEEKPTGEDDHIVRAPRMGRAASLHAATNANGCCTPCDNDVLSPASLVPAMVIWPWLGVYPPGS